MHWLLYACMILYDFLAYFDLPSASLLKRDSPEVQVAPVIAVKPGKWDSIYSGAALKTCINT